MPDEVQEAHIPGRRVVGRVTDPSRDPLPGVPVSLIEAKESAGSGWRLEDQPSLDSAVTDADGSFTLHCDAAAPTTQMVNVVVWGCPPAPEDGIVHPRPALTAVTVPVPMSGSAESVLLCVSRQALRCGGEHRPGARDHRAASAQARAREATLRADIRKALPRSALSLSAARRNPGELSVARDADPGPAVLQAARSGWNAAVRKHQMTAPVLRLSPADLRALGVEPDAVADARVDLATLQDLIERRNRPGMSRPPRDPAEVEDVLRMIESSLPRATGGRNDA